jgi:nondiscriminating aspartyl-tRNA synthetase
MKIMERILIKDTVKKIGEIVSLKGWVNIRRDHGKLIFIDLRDRSGMVQTVVIPADVKETYETAKKLRSEYIIEMEGLVKERPKTAVNEKIPTGRVEIEVKKIKIISKPEAELPFDVSEENLNVSLSTLLDNRVVGLKNRKINSIFKVYAEVLKAYAEFLRSEDFLEIKTSKIVNAATEGGANFFKIKYFDRDAFLAQSPQFYKQAGATVFERVFEIGPVFRAEPHFTSRHVNEYISLDAEMAFIESFEDVMDKIQATVKFIMESVAKNCSETIEMYGIPVPEITSIPRIKLTEALEILEKEYGKKMDTIDIDPEGERLICEYAKKTYDSDFIFLTHYPTDIRPFYTMPSADDSKFTSSFDLLFRGVEIATGSQRIHDYNQLVSSIKKSKLNPDDFSDYLDVFKYGAPPHGGWGMGSERIVQKLLGFKSIKEVILFPRDVRRLRP